MQPLLNASLAISRWHNGAGRKADLATADGWLVGFAWLVEDAPFSNLPGMARTITLIEGLGFKLDMPGQPALQVYDLFSPAHFDGGITTQCRILDPSRVLNAMSDRTRFSHDVSIATAPAVIDPSGTIACLVIALSGQTVITDERASFTLGQFDAVRLDKPAKVQAGRNGYVAIVKIAAISR